jgi:two-component system, OmpR family, response regulator CiaR
MKILVVEDDLNLLDAVAAVLEDEGFEVDRADTGTEGLLLAGKGIYDVLILDIMLPGEDGISIIQKVRKKNIYTPALFLTAKDSIESRVRGLQAGADDYLVKPFAIDELLARIHALIRRSKGFKSEGELRYGPIHIPPNEYEAYCGDKPLKLSSKEFELLSYLLQNKEQILRREQIFNRVWGFDSDANETAVDLYIHYLRKKLISFGCGHLIHTVRGVGYILKEGERHV